MFTGIVEGMGKVVRLERKANLAVLTIEAGKIARALKIGDSLAVSGTCLTVTGKGTKILKFDMMKETLSATSLGRLGPGDAVNLERALKANGRLDGHFVSGHVDAVGTVTRRITLPNYVEIRIHVAAKLMKYIVPKGSVSVDGVSLTVGEVRQKWFSVYLIPHTLTVTTFGRMTKGDAVNIETDILAKYVLFRHGGGRTS